MKRIILLSLVSILFSCENTTNKYEKVIADFVQTDSRGTKYDLNFKAERLEETERISVGDSIKIITDKFNTDREKQIASLQKTVDLFTDNLEKQKTARYPSQVMINSYQSGIDTANSRIDALKESSAEELAKYEGRDENELLVIVVRCTYSIDEPITNKRATETFDFFLSPDGTKCYSRKRVKE